MVRQLYNRIHRKFYYSTSFHGLIAPSTGNKKIRQPRFSFYAKKLLSNLLQTGHNAVLHEQPGILLLRMGKAKVEITSIEELYILNEIYIDGCYNFLTAGDDLTVIDIGLNAGFASLFFAQSAAVRHIYSFEPLEITFNQALKNIALNEESIRNKIIPNNYGLAATSRQEEWDYDYSKKGNIGIRDSFEKDTNRQENMGAKKTTVSLKDASLVLSEIISSVGSQKIIIKMDCEGAEYEILKKLAAAGLLEKIRLLMIEWHLKGPDEITSLLLRHGYSMISQLPLNKVTGMIYAVNHNIS